MTGPNRKFGVGLQVRLNDRQAVHLMLDTGASGISISPKSAEKAGLEILGGESNETRGIGDGRPRDSYGYLAAQVAVGDLAFGNFPIAVFDSAKTSAYDGLIGADVFRRFLVTIDFPHSSLVLDPFPNGQASGEPEDAGPLAGGFLRAMRFHNHLTIPTAVNQERPRLFLIDSGASTNMIDAAIASESTRVSRDNYTNVHGVQGRVKDVARADRVTLTFAGFRQPNHDLLAMDMDKVSDSLGAAVSGILGMPVLWNMRLTIDYRDGAVRFEYQPDGKSR
jgi:hypothetical protein